MSKEQTPAENPNKLEKTYKYFDLESFESKSETVVDEFVPATNLAEVNERINGDEAILIAAMNAYLKAQKLAEMEKSVASKGGKKSVVFQVIRPFRAMPPFNVIGATKDAKGQWVKDKEGNIIISDRAAQTKAILEMVKKNPDMIESIKAASLEAPAEGEESEDTTE